MGYQFKQQESLTTGVQRIAREQLSQAILELKQSEQNPHRAIHEVRKQFKKTAWFNPSCSFWFRW